MPKKKILKEYSRFLEIDRGKDLNQSMGPRDLFHLLNKDFKDKLSRKIYSQLTIGVDASIYSYQMLRGC